MTIKEAIDKLEAQGVALKKLLEAANDEVSIKKIEKMVLKLEKTVDKLESFVNRLPQ